MPVALLILATQRSMSRVLFEMGLALLLGLWMVAEPVFGVDARGWGRNMQSHGDWTSVEFRDPVSGRLAASRAGTDDLPRHATLTLTASPLDGCAANAVVVIEQVSPNPDDLEESVKLRIAIDGRQSSKTDARIIRPRGDRFEFVEILGPYDTAPLYGHQTMTLSLGHVQIARFSLKGFASAWGETQRVCRQVLQR